MQGMFALDNSYLRPLPLLPLECVYHMMRKFNKIRLYPDIQIECDIYCLSQSVLET